jgi:pilus assembly protein CpaC
MSRTLGGWVGQISSGFTTGTLGGNVGAVRSLNGVRDISKLISIEAEKRDGQVRILAEPNVMAISGQEGSFLAGGKILIPVAQANTTGVLTVTLQEKEFGVGLKFTPTVIGDGRINLRVAPEVSELSKEGVGITANGIGGSSILPLITTRRASTTIQLSDGQSFAIGGLIKSTSTANVKAFPVLGEIPILGALFRSTDYQLDRTELVFIVTPRIVKALPPDYVLPTDRVGDPDRKTLMLQGIIDSTPKPTEAQGGMTLK